MISPRFILKFAGWYGLVLAVWFWRGLTLHDLSNPFWRMSLMLVAFGVLLLMTLWEMHKDAVALRARVAALEADRDTETEDRDIHQQDRPYVGRGRAVPVVAPNVATP